MVDASPGFDRCQNFLAASDHGKNLWLINLADSRIRTSVNAHASDKKIGESWRPKLPLMLIPKESIIMKASHWTPEVKFIRMNDVLTITGLSRATIYSEVKKGTFPAPVKIGPRASRFLLSDVEGWVASKVEVSRGRGP